MGDNTYLLHLIYSKTSYLVDENGFGENLPLIIPIILTEQFFNIEPSLLYFFGANESYGKNSK